MAQELTDLLQAKHLGSFSQRVSAFMGIDSQQGVELVCLTGGQTPLLVNVRFARPVVTRCHHLHPPVLSLVATPPTDTHHVGAVPQVTTNSNECGAVKSFGLHVLEPSLAAGAGICMQTNQCFGEDVKRLIPTESREPQKACSRSRFDRLTCS